MCMHCETPMGWHSTGDSGFDANLVFISNELIVGVSAMTVGVSVLIVDACGCITDDRGCISDDFLGWMFFLQVLIKRPFLMISTRVCIRKRRCKVVRSKLQRRESCS